MSVLNDLKVLTNVNESVLNIYIRRAETLIRSYMNLRSDDATKIADAYPDAAIQYVMECLSRKGNEGVKQFTQGGRQGTFESGLSEDVKALLPPPFVRMMG